jgi:hypothetical protein
MFLMALTMMIAVVEPKDAMASEIVPEGEMGRRVGEVLPRKPVILS